MGKISFTDNSAGDPNFGWGSYTVGNYGTLVFENCTVMASSGTGLQSVVRVEGLLRVQVNTTDFGTLPRPGDGSVSIGDTGTLYGFGSIRMSQFGDIDYGGGEALAKGAFHLDCGNGKIRLIQD